MGERPLLGYCTNVHAGATLERTLANLTEHAVAVKRAVSPDLPLGVGLWLSAAAARTLIDERRVEQLRDFLLRHGLVAYTFNGFPHGDFHQPVVKHAVYRPSWFDPDRESYTIDLARILAGLLEESAHASISTLPIGWPADCAGREAVEAADRLRRVALELERIESETGRYIHLDLEPEPGCLLTDSRTLVDWFQTHLLRSGEERRLRRYLGVCHDICHAAVMFEGQREAIERYRAAGIRIGKLQVSSAVRMELDRLDVAERREARDQLGRFGEQRYLHQTMIRSRQGRRFLEDLPRELLASGDDAAVLGEWRVHFHVPIYLEKLDKLGTTQAAIVECLELFRDDEEQCPQIEVESYAWDVLPVELRQPTLADGISRELSWLIGQLR